MKDLSRKSLDTICNISVAASIHCTEMIGAGHAAHFMAGKVSPEVLLYQLYKIRESFAKVGAAMANIDAVIDEVEGREPVVVDEQDAA
jgi:hypothetical protein